MLFYHLLLIVLIAIYMQIYHLLLIMLSAINIFNGYSLGMGDENRLKNDLFSLIRLGNVKKVESFLNYTFDENNNDFTKEISSTLIVSEDNIIRQSSLFSYAETRKQFIDDVIVFEPLLHYCVHHPRPQSGCDKVEDYIDGNGNNIEESQNDDDQNNNIVNNGPDNISDEERRAMIEKGRLQVAKYLLNLRYPSVSLEAVDSDGLTVLHLASKNGDYKILKLLLNHAYGNRNENNKNGRIIPSFDINCKCLKLGWTSMHYCANQGDVISLKLLIQAGASPTIKAGPMTYTKPGISLINRTESGSTATDGVENRGALRVGTSSIIGSGFTPLGMIKLKLQSSYGLDLGYESNLQSVVKELEKSSREMKSEKLHIEANKFESLKINQLKLTHKKAQEMKKVANKSEILALKNCKHFDLIESAGLYHDIGGIPIDIESAGLKFTSLGSGRLESGKQSLISVKSCEVPMKLEVVTSGKISAVALSVASAASAAVIKTGAVISKVLRSKSKRNVKPNSENVVKFVPNIPLSSSTSSIPVPTFPIAALRVIPTPVCFIPPTAKKWLSNNNGLSPTSAHRIEVEKTLTWLCSRSSKGDNLQKKIDSHATESNFKKNQNKLGSGSRSGSLGSHASTMSTTNSSLSRSSNEMRAKQSRSQKGLRKETDKSVKMIEYETTGAEEKLSQLKEYSLGEGKTVSEK